MPARGRYSPYDVTPLERRTGGTEFHVSTAFGRLRCLRGGPPGGDRVTVFVHGVHDDMDSWGPLMQAAIRGAVDIGPFLFVDLPGFGRSENLRRRLDLAEVGDALMKVAVSDLGFGSLRLVGHSMGTLVVADMAVRHARLVESLHLVAGPYYSIVDTINGHPSGGLGGALAAATFGTQYLLAISGRLGVGALKLASRTAVLRPLLWPFLAHPWLIRQSVLDHLLADLRPASFRAATRNAFRYRNGMSWSEVRCPVWAVYGSADRLVPTADQRRLLADLPSARVTSVADAAHLVHLEQPHAVLAGLGLT